MKTIQNLGLMVLLSVFALSVLWLSCDKIKFDAQNVNSKSELSQKMLNKDYQKFGLKDITYEAMLDTLGKWHNEFQSVVLDTLIGMGSNELISDFSKMNEITVSVSKKILEERGINYDQDYITKITKAGSLSTANQKDKVINSTVLSTDAKQILNDLLKAIASFTVYDANFKNTLRNLHDKSLSLTKEVDLVTVGIATSTALNSYAYWSGVGEEKWNNLKFADSIIIRSKYYKNTTARAATATGKSCKVNLYKVGGADGVAAVSGAIDGAVLGPGRSIAIGVLSAAVSSSYNAIHQKLDCKYSWWPF